MGGTVGLRLHYCTVGHDCIAMHTGIVATIPV